MKNRNIFIILGIAVLIGAFFILNAGGASGIEATYYKSISCGCCDVHSKYIDSKGFDVKINNLQDVTAIKSQFGVPSAIESCHTAMIEGYFVEGHIPVEAINRMLEERPDIKGIAMPGMPSGSPGMPGQKIGDFVIYAVNHDGTYYEYMRI